MYIHVHTHIYIYVCVCVCVCVCVLCVCVSGYQKYDITRVRTSLVRSCYLYAIAEADVVVYLPMTGMVELIHTQTGVTLNQG